MSFGSVNRHIMFIYKMLRAKFLQVSNLETFRSKYHDLGIEIDPMEDGMDALADEAVYPYEWENEQNEHFELFLNMVVAGSHQNLKPGV